jgi:addiction module RelB/DinJ family antitoxin
METKTVINIKTDRDLKIRAQKLSKNLGLPLGTVINAYLREFVSERRIVFSEPLSPNIKIQKVLDQALKDVKAKKNLYGPFKNPLEMDRFLDSC